MGRPHRRCSGLGRSERIRVPSPAARTTAERRRRASAAFLARRAVRRAYGTLVACRSWSPTTSSGCSTRTPPSTACPTPGPPTCAGSTSRSRPGRKVSQPGLGHGRRPSWCCSTAGRRTPTPGTPWRWPWAGRCVAVDLPGHGHSDGGPEGSVSAGSNGRDLRDRRGRAGPRRPRAWWACRSAACPSIALAAHAPELVRALVLVDITPGVNAEKAAPVTNFVNGPASFASFDELLARTMEHNPTRSESSLRRGILHNAVQREDGSWVWRYARFRTEDAAAQPEFGDWWEAVSGAHRPAAARPRAWPGRWSTTTTRPSSCAASPRARWWASRGRATASRATGRSSWPPS